MTRASHVGKASVGIGLVGMLVLTFPSAAWAPPPGPITSGHITVNRTPAGGPPGTQIAMSGTCTGGDAGSNSTVDVILRTIDGDDGVFGHADFPVASDGTWNGTVTVEPGSGQRDLDMDIDCANTQVVLPFFVTDRNTTARPTIVTGIGAKPCGAYGNPPPGIDPAQNCLPDVKSFTADGAIAAANFVADVGAWGANVAVGNVDGSGDPEIVVGAGPVSVPVVATYTLVGAPVGRFFPYGEEFIDGIHVAAADLDGDGKAEIITGPGPGGPPNVRVFSGTGTLLASFLAYDPGFLGGVDVAAVNGEIVTGAGSGGGPHVRRFTASGHPIGGGFFAYDPAFAGGVHVAAGQGRIVTGPGRGGGPNVRVFGLTGSLRASFVAYDPAFTGGVFVAVGDAGIVTGAGGAPHVRSFSLTGDSLGPGFFAYEQRFEAGVPVATVPPA